MLALDHADITGEVYIDFAASRKALAESVASLRANVLQPPAAMDPIAWMYHNIKLPKTKTERSGEFVPTGYQREFVRMYFEEQTKEIDVTKATRVGMSLLLSCMAAYILAYLGESVTIAQPTEKDAQEYYRERIEPLFEICQALGALRRAPKRGESQDSWNLIEFSNGSVLRLVGAESDDNFRRYGSKHNWGDEYSAKAWRPKKGSQGEKADLFNERGGEFTQPKLVLISSPLGKDDCQTTARHAKSDRCDPWTACPHCREMQVMEWGDRDTLYGFKWTKDADGFVDDVWYECRACHQPFREHEQFDEPVTVNGIECLSFKQFLDASTSYRPSATWKEPGRRGMYIPQWLSLSGQASWKNLAQRFLNARGDPERMKTWVNNVRGVAYDDFTTSAMDGTALTEWQARYPAEVPDDVVVIVAGGDTQTNKEGSDLEQLASREIQVVGFNRHGQLRHIAYRVIEGAPGDHRADAELTALLDRTWRKRDGSEWRIEAAAIDLGGHFADETRAYCARFHSRRNIWAVKGRNNAKGTRSSLVWPTKPSKSQKAGAKFYTIDSQLARDAVFRLLQLKGEHAPMFPASLPPDFFERLMCEERKKVNGGWYWQPKKGGRAEEEWMTLAYAYAALQGLRHSRPRQWRDLKDAGDRLGVPEVLHDPETGELDYEGPDRSVQASGNPEGAEAAPKDSASKAAARPAAPAAEPAARQGAPTVKRKKNRGFVVASSSWGYGR